ncbi:hypothetical protein RHGRI_004193 [Rhododendron griersonianum]|uniref:Phosphotransferase n=1 Tax=Rhododendron griersonianum TaxID=479676 RepID=A0AAV6L8K4_9ERIC|nr:hypothetical protein RHGRI_004193 [Rhododendron griersonianum]
MSPTANSSPSPASPTAGPFPPVSPISGASSRFTGGPASPKKTTDSSLVREVWRNRENQISENQREVFMLVSLRVSRFDRYRCQGLAKFAEKEGGKYHLPQGRKREIGFTFSFPVRQSSIDSGILIKWTKEWGAFSTGITLTQFDRDMDVESINPGEQIFEKTISGMYLDEIVRRVLLKMAEASDLFGKSDMEKLSTQFVLRYYNHLFFCALVSPFLLDESVEEMDEYCLNGLHGDEPPESELEHGINQYLSLYAGSGVLRCKFLQGKAMEGAGAVGLLFYLLCLPV